MHRRGLASLAVVTRSGSLTRAGLASALANRVIPGGGHGGPPRELGDRMRTLLLVSVVTACSSKPSEPPVETGAFRFEDVVDTTEDATEVRVNRRDVPLERMPLAAFLGGLPMTGNANVQVDLRIPIVDGAHDARGAAGRFALACPKGCAIGDGVARLQFGTSDLPFGRLTFDELDVRGEIKDGRVEITRWHARSKDVTLELALKIALASDFGASALDGCVTFKADPMLADRDPKTAAVIATTGANADASGLFHIAIGGSAGAKKLLARACGDQIATSE